MPRVLVVEDDPSSRRALALLLKLKGFEALPAASLAEAMRMIEEHPPFVLLDLMLPDGNGATVLEHVRTKNLPIRVAVTSGASNWEALLGHGRLQADAYFAKPINFDDIVRWLSAS